ncbi:MAG: type VI secretion system baseplate subunit TssG [Planctomycetes bacterium]|nr:type VI secretion system baseplate subunit TssG [Planctomycetota bacterium]
MNVPVDRLSGRLGFAEAAVLLRRVVQGADEARRRRGEDVRFVGDHGLGFPSDEFVLHDVDDGGRARMSLSFLGLTGTMGVLPAHYSELVQRRLRAGDATLQRFLDVFVDRLGRLFLLAHRKQRFWLDFAWTLPAAVDGPALAARAGRRHPFEEVLYGLLGLGSPAMRERAGLLPLGILHYAGVLARRPRSAIAVAGVLADVFDTDTRIEPFLGEWTPIPPDECSTLGREGLAELGRSLYLGDRWFDAARGYRVRLGPMSLGRLQSLLPGTPGAERLCGFLPYAVGPDEPFDWVLELVNDEVPQARLTCDDDAPQRLGQTFWLFSDDDGARRGRVESGPFLPVQAHTDPGAGRWSQSA